MPSTSSSTLPSWPHSPRKPTPHHAERVGVEREAGHQLQHLEQNRAEPEAMISSRLTTRGRRPVPSRELARACASRPAIGVSSNSSRESCVTSLARGTPAFGDVCQG